MRTAARIAALGCGVLAMASAAVGQAMTLEQAAEQAVRTNPQMERVLADRRAQDAELRQARGLYYPRVDLSADVGPEWTETRAIDDETLLRYDTSITMTQLLFDGFGREARIEQNAARVDGAALRVAERLEALSLDVSEAFLDVLRYQALERLALENVETHETLLQQVGRRVDVGQSGVGDRQQAQSRLAAARDTLVRTRQDMKDALARFQRVIGTPPDELREPVSLADRLPPGVDDAVLIAINASPTLRATATGIDEAHARHREATASYYPTLEMELQGSRNFNRDGVEGMNNDATALVKLTWNIFNGGIDEARRTEAAHRIGSARAETMDAERALAEQTRRAWNALEAARERVDILREQVAANEQVVGTYRQEFLIGVRDMLDLLDSENELFQARSALTSSEYVTEFAVHRVLAGMGQLAAALGAPRPEEASATARQGAGVTPQYAFGERTLEDVHRSAAGAAAARHSADATATDTASLAGDQAGDAAGWRARDGAGPRPLITVHGPQSDLPMPHRANDGRSVTDPEEQALSEPPAAVAEPAGILEDGSEGAVTDVAMETATNTTPLAAWNGSAGAPPVGTISLEQALADRPDDTAAPGDVQVGARLTGGENDGGLVIFWNDPPPAPDE